MFDTTFTCGIAPSAAKTDLEAGFFDHIWKLEKTRQKKIAMLNKTTKIFSAYGLTTPDEMPSSRAEIEFFFDQHLKGENFPSKSGLKTVKNAQRWMKDYCAVIDVVNGAREAKAATRQRDDDWAALLAYVSGRRDVPQNIRQIRNDCGHDVCYRVPPSGDLDRGTNGQFDP